LTPDQRVWFSVEPLTTGGVVDHYINYGAEHNQETIADLERLGFNDVSEMLKRINRLFKNGYPPVDISERNDEISNLSDEDEALLDDIEKDFWKRCNELEEALLHYINETGIGIQS
jgi:hypothetical protein